MTQTVRFEALPDDHATAFAPSLAQAAAIVRALFPRFVPAKGMQTVFVAQGASIRVGLDEPVGVLRIAMSVDVDGAPPPGHPVLIALSAMRGCGWVLAQVRGKERRPFTAAAPTPPEAMQRANLVHALALRGDDGIDWAALETAFGPATDVPNLLDFVASDERVLRDYGWEELVQRVLHQGTVYSATPVALSGLIARAKEHVALRADALHFVHLCVEGRFGITPVADDAAELAQDEHAVRDAVVALAADLLSLAREDPSLAPRVLAIAAKLPRMWSAHALACDTLLAGADEATRATVLYNQWSRGLDETVELVSKANHQTSACERFAAARVLMERHAIDEPTLEWLLELGCGRDPESKNALDPWLKRDFGEYGADAAARALFLGCPPKMLRPHALAVVEACAKSLNFEEVLYPVLDVLYGPAPTDPAALDGLMEARRRFRAALERIPNIERVAIRVLEERGQTLDG